MTTAAAASKIHKTNRGPRLLSRRKRTSGKTSLGVTQRARARQRAAARDFLFLSSADTVTIAAPRRHGLGHAPRTGPCFAAAGRHRSPAPHAGGGRRGRRFYLIPGVAGAKEGYGRRWLHVGQPAGLSCERHGRFARLSFPGRPREHVCASWRFDGNHSVTNNTTLAGRRGRQRLVKDFPLLPRGILLRHSLSLNWIG